MGSVAAAMRQRGYGVTGSDAGVYPPMSTFLAEQGIEVVEGYRADNIPTDATTVVIGNAISRGNDEAEEVLNRRILYRSLPEVLKEYFLRGKRNFVVSGTHGKTTTSALLAWLFEAAGKKPDFMIGGLPKNFGQGARFQGADLTVLEGDEYDTAFFDKRSKFLHYLPEVVVVNRIDFDHADIYNGIEPILYTFERLMAIVPQNGRVFVDGDSKYSVQIAKGVKNVTKVGLNADCDSQITEIDYQPEGTSFLLEGDRYEVPMVGEFNVRNAAMAILSAKVYGLSAAEIQKGLASFEGVARRQEERGVANGVTVVDDFAHHPAAIKLAISALRQKYQGRKLWVAFEPRSNTTRRKVFQQELVDTLAGADAVVLPTLKGVEKIAVEDRLDINQLVDDLGAKGTPCQLFEEVEEMVESLCEQAKEGDVVAVLSNGGFDGLHEKLLTGLQKREQSAEAVPS